MTIYDTFETENFAAYSGSYNARLFYGDFFSQYSNYERAVIADRISGIIPSAFYKLGYTFLAGEARNIVSGAYIGHGVRFMTLGCGAETYVDSQLPSPLYYTQANDGAIIIDERPFSGSELFNIPDARLTGSAMIMFGRIAGLPQLFASPSGTPLIDYVWHPSFPFMSRYKGFTRFNSPSYRLPYAITTEISCAWQPPVAFASSFLDCAPLETTQLGRMIVWSSDTVGWPIDYLHVSGTIDYSKSPYGPIMQDRGMLERATSETQNKVYFGVGIGPFGLVTRGYGGRVASTQIIAPILRGWKYGIFNANQKNPTMVLRPGHHGYLRDILEQRVNTKYFDVTRGITLEGPVVMTPLTGTLLHSQSRDYLTATNPSYNPRDSGAWDYEYRSGQPFFDLERI